MNGGAMRIRRVVDPHAADGQAGGPGNPPLDLDPAAIDKTPGQGVVVGRVGPLAADGRRSVEVVVDGWRFDLVVEDAARAALSDRATRDRLAVGAGGGPVEIRAIIPGRVAAVHVIAGDTVAAGDPVLVVEAMKMQNEVRAPRDGTVDRVAVGVGQTIEIGDLLVVLG